MAVVALRPEVKAYQITCQGCGRAVKELSPASVAVLLPFDHYGISKTRAFECTRCEAIIFEAELVNGRFIPPQLRASQSRSPKPT